MARCGDKKHGVDVSCIMIFGLLVCWLLRLFSWWLVIPSLLSYFKFYHCFQWFRWLIVAPCFGFRLASSGVWVLTRNHVAMVLFKIWKMSERFHPQTSSNMFFQVDMQLGEVIILANWSDSAETVENSALFGRRRLLIHCPDVSKWRDLKIGWYQISGAFPLKLNHFYNK